jgi:hypothetical protein
MPTSFGMADRSVQIMLADICKQHHQPLDEAEVIFGIIMASNEDGPAVKAGGYPAAATVKIVPLKDRLAKKYDVEIMIDYSVWDSLSHTSREALLDHELSHVQLAKFDWYVEKGDPEQRMQIRCDRDDLGRPKCKLRPADWNAGDGFLAVVERYGESAIEIQNLMAARRLTESRK